jgi:putative ABC transport system permease protein
MTARPLGELGVAVRTIARRPGFAAATILVLAIGIAAVSTMFSTLNSVVLRPLPFDRPGELVWLYSSSQSSPRNSTSALDYFDYRQQFTAFDMVAATLVFRPTIYLSGRGGLEPEPLKYNDVSHNFFTTLGVRPVIGRTFLAAEEEAGAANVIIVSHGVWQRLLGGRPEAVGQPLTLDGSSYEIVGVMPADFAFPAEVDLWRPLRCGEGSTDGRGNNNFSMFGRLRPGVGIAAAQAEGSVLARQIEQAYPDTKEGWGLLLVPMHEVFFGDYRPAMAMLMAAVLLLLLVTCANVSSLFLARGVSSQAELALRSALGASRGRVAWHVLAESLVFAVTGGALGLALAWLGIRGVRALAPAGIPRVDQIAIDSSVAAFTAGICILAGLVAGVAPAVRSSRVNPGDALRKDSRTVGAGSSAVLRSGLVVVQIGLSLVLLIGSGLLVKGLLRIHGADVGFTSSNLLLADVRPPTAAFENPERLSAFYWQVAERLRTVPGVTGVAIGEQLPFLPGGTWNGVFAGDRPAPTPDNHVGAQRRRVSDGFFQTLGIEILQGRALAATDTLGRSPVVVINQALAERLWPDEPAVGKTLVLPWSPPVRMKVVGVAANIKEFGPAADPRPTFYPPIAQLPARSVQLGVRTAGDPTAVVSLVKQAAAAVDPTVGISAFQTMESRFMSRTAAPRFRTVLLSVFGVLSLVIAATGLYGLLAYFVAQRSHELGVRLALGARPIEVVWVVVRRGTGLAGLGIAAGLGGALALSRVMRGLLYGVSPTDVPTFAGVSLGLSLVAVVACVVPAWRAASLDPTVVLRQD